MTAGFVVAFGGVFIVMCAFAIFEYAISRGATRRADAPRASSDIGAALERVQETARQLDREIAHMRATLGS